VIRDELHQMTRWGDRHRRLFARLFLVFAATAIIDLVGTVLILLFDRHHHPTDIHTFGDALFFTTVQLLTVSSQVRNPFTAGARIVDIGLEVWAVIVVAGSAGAIANFFQSAD